MSQKFSEELTRPSPPGIRFKQEPCCSGSTTPSTTETHPFLKNRPDQIAVYVSGPYTQGDPVINTRKAMDLADRLEDAGFRVFCPHLSLFRHLLRERSWKEWMDIDLFWVERCDVLIRIPGPSSGGDMEVTRALELGKPVYFSYEKLIQEYYRITER